MVRMILQDLLLLVGIMAVIACAVILIKKDRRWLFIVAALYTIGYLYFTFFSRLHANDTGSVIRLIPLNSVLKIIEALRIRYIDWGFPKCLLELKWHVRTIISMGFNVLLFLPMGFLIPMIMPKVKHIIAACIVISVLTEMMQVITSLGWMDIDDIILNSVGGIIGFQFIYKRYLQE